MNDRAQNRSTDRIEYTFQRRYDSLELLNRTCYNMNPLTIAVISYSL